MSQVAHTLAPVCQNPASNDFPRGAPETGTNPVAWKKAPGGVFPVERLISPLTPAWGNSSARDSLTSASAPSRFARASASRGCIARASATACSSEYARTSAVCAASGPATVATHVDAATAAIDAHGDRLPLLLRA